MKAIQFVFVILIYFLSLSSYAEEVQKMEIGGSEILYVVEGKGPIPIIMESGLGNGIETWEPIFSDLVKKTQTFIYARPGYNDTKNDGKPKTAEFVVGKLRKTLKKLDIKGPYLLVGHSFGGMYMEYFAKNFPNEVASLVLIDSRHRSFTKDCVKEFGLSKCVPPKEALSKAPENIRQEIEALAAVEEELDNSPDFGNYPVYVLTASKGMDPSQKEHNKLWVKNQQKFTEEKGEILQTISKKSGHFMHYEDKGLVMKTIKMALKRSGLK